MILGDYYMAEPRDCRPKLNLRTRPRVEMLLVRSSLHNYISISLLMRTHNIRPNKMPQNKNSIAIFSIRDWVVLNLNDCILWPKYKIKRN